MNFIIKLFKSKNFIIKKTCNSILIIIDRLIKYIHLILFKKTYTTKQLKFVILNKIIRYHDIFKE